MVEEKIKALIDEKLKEEEFTVAREEKFKEGKKNVKKMVDYTYRFDAIKMAKVKPRFN